MTVVVTTLRTAAREEPDAASTIERTNAVLCRDNAASLFATVFYGVLDLRTGTLDYCNCGHTEPVLLPVSGEPRRLAATGLPLALFIDRPAAASRTQLDPGEDLILVTDGVTEALNPVNEEFGDSRLLQTLLANRNLAPAELIAQLFVAVERFAMGQTQADDITCLGVRRCV
jgi:sigma-B regulation protein RsbU (phosphoserine phosphatase)